MDRNNRLKMYEKIQISMHKKALVYSDGYLPENVLYRDPELAMLYSLCSGAQHVILTGYVATGKTFTIKVYLRDMEYAKNHENLYVYFDCKKLTINAIPRIIATKLDATIVTNRSNEENIARIEKKFKETNLSICYLIFDDIDYIFNKSKGNQDFILDFLNSPIFRLILISNTPEWSKKLTHRVQDRLSLSNFLATMEFELYDKSQLKGILKQRVEEGTNVDIDEKELNIIVDEVIDRGLSTRNAIAFLSRLVDKKISQPFRLTKEKVKMFLNMLDEDSKYNAFLRFPAHLQIEIMLITHQYINHQYKYKDGFTPKEIIRLYEKYAKKKNLKVRKSSSIYNDLNNLHHTYNFLTKHRVSKKGEGGYNNMFLPDFDYENFYEKEKENYEKFKNFL